MAVFSTAAIVGCSRNHDASALAAAVQSQDEPSLSVRAADGDLPYPTKDWPLFRGDALARGVSGSTLPEAPEVVWNVEYPEQSFFATAVVADGTIYLGSILGPFYAFSLADGSEKWKREDLEDGFEATAAVKDGLVYVGDAMGTFHCLDDKTGETKWSHETLGPINNGANFYKDTIIFGSQDAYLYCLNATTGEEVWKLQLADQIRCFPSVVGNRTFVAGCDGELHVIDLDLGKEVGKVPVEGPTGCSPAVMGDSLFVGNMDSSLFRINWKNIKLDWKYQHAKRKFEYRSSAAVTKNVVVVGNQGKMVLGLNPESGEEKWVHNTRAGVDSSPVIVGSRAYFGGIRGKLSALDIASGEEVWSYETGGQFDASPIVADGKLIIGNADGTLYCFGSK
ncbi:MAG: PQQ-binding-like beta-propeller repeat protein [Pirellulales bacterium]|nr:PQQ-binding-like beta-propeller repeat protein [Pirellulales bacterium]